MIRFDPDIHYRDQLGRSGHYWLPKYDRSKPWRRDCADLNGGHCTVHARCIDCAEITHFGAIETDPAFDTGLTPDLAAALGVPVSDVSDEVRRGLSEMHLAVLVGGLPHRCYDCRHAGDGDG